MDITRKTIEMPNQKKTTCRYGHEDLQLWVGKSGAKRIQCRTCKREQSVASRVGPKSKHAPAMVAKYDLRIMEARAKIQKIQSQIDELEKKRDNFISQRKERNDLL